MYVWSWFYLPAQFTVLSVFILVKLFLSNYTFFHVTVLSISSDLWTGKEQRGGEGGGGSSSEIE